ncbi:hypothetical protein AAG570_014137 [Ranatra chinensis]|uniref:Integrase catalytic domain-containing protein n=1 Tax=Ranatra chinensis TaxID=642074 RepID=A0ABD0Y798_9HEMI
MDSRLHTLPEIKSRKAHGSPDWSVSSCGLEQVDLDIIGPLPPSRGKAYCLTMIDRCTRWPEAVPIRETSAETIARAFYERWISRFGASLKITKDQGRQFESQLFTRLTTMLGIQRLRTSAYPPQANVVKRWHCSLKAALTARLDTANWVRHLPTILLGLRVVMRVDKTSTAELVYGRTLRLPEHVSVLGLKSCTVITRCHSRLRTASKHWNMFYHNKKQETTEIDSTEDVVPTVGFARVKLVHRGFKVIIYDVGGGPQIRGIWSKYFNDVHGVIFVVDASDNSRIGECKTELENMLCHEKLAGKPVLLLANKQDVVGAMDEIDIVESLCLEQLVNEQKCPTKVEICSTLLPNMKARQQKGHNIDPGLLSGYRWLLSQIISNYGKLNARVERDVKMEQERVAMERENWKRRKERDENLVESGGVQEATLNESECFRPINEIIKSFDNNISTPHKTELKNGSCGEITVDSNQNEALPSACGPNDRGNGTEGGSNITSDIRDQLENKGKLQSRKLSVVGVRNNKVRPNPGVVEGELPPLIVAAARRDGVVVSPPLRWRQLPPIKRPPPLGLRPVTSRSLGNEGEAWGLRDDLEVVLPPSNRTCLPKSDNDDVVIG